MNKHKVKILCIIGAVLLLAALCGTVLAYMFRVTDRIENIFAPAHVDCEVQEKTDTPMTEKNSVTVKNTGNIDAYLRVRFVSYWVRVTDDGKSEIVSKPSEMPKFKIADGWIAGGDDTYYYKSPVPPSQFTNELLAEGEKILLAEQDGYRQVIEVFAEAIQSEPASSVIESWSVALDTEGNILG